MQITHFWSKSGLDYKELVCTGKEKMEKQGGKGGPELTMIAICKEKSKMVLAIEKKLCFVRGDYLERMQSFGSIGSPQSTEVLNDFHL